MSFTVTVIPEDATYNGYMLRPLVERILREAGKPKARVIVPALEYKGYEHVKAHLAELCNEYAHTDLILFLFDRDGKAGREIAATSLTEKYQRLGNVFVAQCAHQEIETWLLAGHHTKLDRDWASIRSDSNVKEKVFNEFLLEYGDAGKGNGRERLMKEGLQNFAGLYKKCPELKSLTAEIRKII